MHERLGSRGDNPGQRVLFEHPLRFFAQISNVFGTPVHTSFPHTAKISDQVHSRTGHQVRSSDLTSVKA